MVISTVSGTLHPYSVCLRYKDLVNRILAREIVSASDGGVSIEKSSGVFVPQIIFDIFLHCAKFFYTCIESVLDYSEGHYL
mmetsp:Transcript_19255/g.41903  ORF Transcript_19255/g.41903 Transcript_19255/m.41903 type:complete len:81 (+) Transcript_19255:312-554(+)